MACRNANCLLNAATLLGPLVIVFVVLGFATDHWTETDVDRTKLSTFERDLSNSNADFARILHTRHRGILRECYPKDSALFLKTAQNVVGGDCFYIEFEDTSDREVSSEYTRRMHLMRGVLALYVLGVIAAITTFVMGIILCLAKNCHLAHAVAICSCFGALFILAAIVLFHAQEYVEANKDGEAGETMFQNTWSKTLLQATDSSLGYSYALAWVGFVLAILDGLLYLLVSRAMRLRDLSDDYSSITSSSSDRKPVIPDYAYDGSQVYDNHAMKFNTHLPTPLYVEGYPPGIMQTIPAVPALTYGNSVYKMAPSDYSRDA